MALKLYSRATHALRFWLLRHLPTCKDMVTVMSESLERPLTLRERVLMKLHLWICSWCAWYLEHLQLMRAALRMRTVEADDDDESSSISLSREARERLKLSLNRRGQ